MGLLPSWSSSSGDVQNPKVKGAKPTGDGAYEAPGRLSRAQCWDARDGFNQCLDRNNILDAIKDKDAADKACGQESQNFEKNCASSWVSVTSCVSYASSHAALASHSKYYWFNNHVCQLCTLRSTLCDARGLEGWLATFF